MMCEAPRLVAFLLTLSLGSTVGGTALRAQVAPARSVAQVARDDAGTRAALTSAGWRVLVRGGGWMTVVPPTIAARADVVAGLRLLPDGRAALRAGPSRDVADPARQWRISPADLQQPAPERQPFALLAAPSFGDLLPRTSSLGDVVPRTSSLGDAVPWTPPWPLSPLDEPRGVVVGIVDTGILLEHQAFKDSTGASRVAWYWAQSATSGGERMPDDMGYGRECAPKAHGLASCAGLPPDWNGHGTHVASVAAGSDRDSTYRGVAPGAVIIGVGLPDAASPADLVNGIYYVFQRARSLGLPAVVNLSFGSENGPHDAADLIARLIEPMLGPGRIVVSSASNAGANGSLYLATAAATTPPSVHAESAVPSSSPYAAEWTIRSAPPPIPPAMYSPLSRIDSTDLMVVELWIAPNARATTDSTPRVTLTAPNGVVLSLNADTVAAVRADTVLGASLRLQADHGWAFGGDSTRWRIGVLMEGTAASGGRLTTAAGLWRLTAEPRTRSAQPAEIWLASQRFDRGTREGATLEHGLNRHLVSSPSLGGRIVSVAAWANAPTLATSSPAPYQCGRCSRTGDLAWFSSPGPRTDGVLKPDITAPGDQIAGARVPGSLLFGDDSLSRSRIAVNPAYGYLRGTSQASPQVAGTIAHALAVYPMLTPEEALAALRGSALHDAMTLHSYSDGDSLQGRNPNASWGAGRMANRAVAVATSSARASRLTITPELNPVRGERSVRFRLDGGDATDAASQLEVFGMTGARITSRSVAQSPSAREVTWDLTDDAGRDVSSGIYVVRIRTSARQVAQFRLVVVRP